MKQHLTDALNMAVSQLETFITELEEEHTSTTDENKQDELQERIELAQAAIDAIEDVG
jgi:hypothetical protein